MGIYQLNPIYSETKNQVMKKPKGPYSALFSSILCCWFFCCAVCIGLLWGCAAVPTKTQLGDKPQTFEENTIISSQLGRPVEFKKLVEDLNRCRIIYVGEKHTNVFHHEIQFEIIQAVYKDHPNLVVGMEMFDRSYQTFLDEWSAGQLDERTFLRKVHWYANWRYDFSLYRDILNFIKENNIRLVGLNIPFHIPSKIRVGGIENLGDDDKIYLPKKIDTSNQDHREYVAGVFEHHNFGGKVDFEDFYTAQAVWDDAMAAAVADNLGNDVMIVLAGNGHIQYKYGVPDRAFRLTSVAFRTIYPVAVGENIDLKVADYIWVTKSSQNRQ
jgi:uncharacterized iron-regulated protein